MATNGVNKLVAMVRLTRPGQWMKNLFVGAPLLFSGQFRQGELIWRTAVVFLGFCAVSGAVYVFNDICDTAQDRNHPQKRNRPLAAGQLSVFTAYLLSGALAVAGLMLGWGLSRRVGGVILMFVVLNIAYSLFLKRMVILDVMTIAAGFVLRILGGATAITVAASPWLVLCTIMISLFLGFTKRRAELVALETQNGNCRQVLKEYSLGFLDQVIAIVTGATLICYALYTVDDNTTRVLGHRAMILTVPPVLYGILRYLYLIYHQKKGADPATTLLHDLPMLVNLLLWITISVLVVHFGPAWDLFRS